MWLNQSACPTMSAKERYALRPFVGGCIDWHELRVVEFWIFYPHHLRFDVTRLRHQEAQGLLEGIVLHEVSHSRLAPVSFISALALGKKGPCEGWLTLPLDAEGYLNKLSGNSTRYEIAASNSRCRRRAAREWHPKQSHQWWCLPLA
jgi:hypothetical protein